MWNLLKKDNVALIANKTIKSDEITQYFICNNIVDSHVLETMNATANVFPLYLYPTENEANLGEQRKPNLDETIWRKIDACLEGDSRLRGNDNQKNCGNDNQEEHATTPEHIFDYIYGVLHSPSYRERYKEFLKIDFPRIPYPENAEEFNRLAAIGEKLRKLHLMQEIPQPLTVSFNIPGDNVVSEVRYEKEIPDRVGETKWVRFLSTSRSALRMFPS
jgi:Predicted helicase